MKRFTYRLALSLGMTRERMMSEMSEQELWEWVAMDKYHHHQFLPDSWYQWRHQLWASLAPHSKSVSPEDFEFKKRDDTAAIANSFAAFTALREKAKQEQSSVKQQKSL